MTTPRRNTQTAGFFRLVCILVLSIKTILLTAALIPPSSQHPSNKSETHSSSCCQQDDNNNWETISEFVAIESPWFKLVGEKLQDHEKGHLFDYWRVEKDHSAVILTMQKDKFVFPKPTFRPGVGCCTLDFPGGRIPRDDSTNEDNPAWIVPSILQRELGMPSETDILSLEPLNKGGEGGWPINSSFNNQLLFGFVARIKDDVELDKSFLYEEAEYFVSSPEDINRLLVDLKCLQCRAVLMQFLLQASCNLKNDR